MGFFLTLNLIPPPSPPFLRILFQFSFFLALLLLFFFLFVILSSPLLIFKIFFYHFLFFLFFSSSFSSFIHFLLPLLSNFLSPPLSAPLTSHLFSFSFFLFASPHNEIFTKTRKKTLPFPPFAFHQNYSRILSPCNRFHNSFSASYRTLCMCL